MRLEKKVDIPRGTYWHITEGDIENGCRTSYWAGFCNLEYRISDGSLQVRGTVVVKKIRQRFGKLSALLPKFWNVMVWKICSSNVHFLGSYSDDWREELINNGLEKGILLLNGPLDRCFADVLDEFSAICAKVREKLLQQPHLIRAKSAV